MEKPSSFMLRPLLAFPWENDDAGCSRHVKILEWKGVERVSVSRSRHPSRL
jgi:hypothetical protein